MATALYEKRQFVNSTTNETIDYEFYGIRGYIGGELSELPLKNLSAAEKIAFKMIAASLEEKPNLTTTTRKATPDEAPTVGKVEQKTILDDDEDDGMDLFN